MFTKRGDRVPAEAAALAEARHPGVVELVDSTGDVLRTNMVDGRSLADMGPVPAAEIAGVAAAVASILADLHDLGVVHGGIDASHVLVAVDGRPLLCSLGRGGDRADDVAALGRLVRDLLAQAPPEHRERSGRGQSGRRRLGPMLAPPVGPTLAALAAEAMAGEPAARPTARAFAEAVRQRISAARLPGITLPPSPEHRVSGVLMRGAGKKGRIAALSAGKPGDQRRCDSSSTFPIPDRLRRSGGDNLPIATESAAKAADRGQHDTGPGSSNRGHVHRSGETRGSRRRSRSPVVTALAGGMAGLLAVVSALAGITLAGAWALTRGGGRAAVTPAAEKSSGPRARPGAHNCIPACASADPYAPKATHGSMPPEPVPATPDPPSAPATTVPMATRVWPVEPLDLRDGVVTYRGSSYALGGPGDSLVAGDWNCSGEPSLALLRRNAGEIFAFDGWPDDRGTITARRVGQVEHALDLRVVDGDGCHELEVQRRAAPPVRLRVRR